MIQEYLIRRLKRILRKSVRISIISSLDEIKELIKNCLNQLYNTDNFILERNKGKGVCERSIVFRFAHYLQNRIEDYFVDCDFNSSYKEFYNSQGNIVGKERNGKPIKNKDGTVIERFVDIIVHKRNYLMRNDFICFEIKKWTNTNSKEIKKDRDNLRILTSKYGYIYGFHITIHKIKTKTKWTIFKGGIPIEEESKVFENETSN